VTVVIALIGAAVGLARPLAAQPLTPRFNPARIACVDTPPVTLVREWQVSAPRSIPDPVRPGELVAVGLRNKFGAAGEFFPITARVVGPDGGATSASRTLFGSEFAYLLYPASFPGAAPLAPGVYTVVWEIDGGYVSCDGFAVADSEPAPLPASAEQAVAEVARLLMPGRPYVGLCESAVEGRDAGKLCGRFVEERCDVQAWRLAVYQSDGSIWVFVAHTDSGWRVLAADPPYETGGAFDLIGPPWSAVDGAGCTGAP
jgi:hypothetical protein